MIEDLFVSAPEDPFVPGPWDLGAVGFADDPPEEVLQRASKYLLSRGYHEVRIEDDIAYERGTEGGSLHGPRVRSALVRVAVEAVQPGVYEVFFSIRLHDHLVSVAERAYHRAERDGVVRAIERRTPIAPEWLDRVEVEADSETRAAAAEITTLHFALASLVVFAVFAVLGLGQPVFGFFLVALCGRGAYAVVAGYRRNRQERQDVIAAAESPPRDPLPVLAESISAVGYWRSWSVDTKGRFDVFFSHTQLWNPRGASGHRPPGPLGLRFVNPSFVGFLTDSSQGPGPISPAWPEDLAAARCPGQALLWPGMVFNSRAALARQLESCTVRPLIGATPPPPAEEEAVLVFRAGPLGLAVVAEKMSIHTTLGEITPQGVDVLRNRWVHHWFNYWVNRLGRDDTTFDPVCELEIPLHPDLNEPGTLRTVLAGPPGW